MYILHTHMYAVTAIVKHTLLSQHRDKSMFALAATVGGSTFRQFYLSA